MEKAFSVDNGHKFHQSPLFLAFFFASLMLITLPLRWGAVLFFVSLMGVVRFPHRLPKSLLYELAIADLIVRSRLSKKIPWLNHQWWHEIIPGLVLGGIPLENYQHLGALRSKGISAVYAVLEDFEATSRTFCSAPVLEKQWIEEGIAYHRLQCKDMSAMPLQDLKAAVSWIHQMISSGKKVYVHCKAGRGRSAMIAAAYLMRYYAMSFKEAISSLIAKRPVITLRPCQRLRLKEFEAVYRLY